MPEMQTKTTLEVVQAEMADLLGADCDSTGVWAAQVQAVATIALAEEVNALRQLLERVIGDDPTSMGLRTPAYVRTKHG